MTARTLTAILWDFDGTLVDSRQQNYRVTQQIVEQVTGRAWREFDALHTLERYTAATTRSQNWRSLYQRELGLSAAQTGEAGSLWGTYQMSDAAPPRCFQGIPEVLRELEDLPHGIVSQNARGFIGAVLARERLCGRFRCIIGHEEVEPGREKPAPDGLLQCLEGTTNLESGYVLYVGDHEIDAECAARANGEFRRRGLDLEVFMVAAWYGGASDASTWTHQPDHEATEPRQILTIAQGLR